ncbi:MAG: UvrABC system protein [Pseudomonadota bacterium]|jgi:excinuclease ABC subunit A
MKEIHLWGVKQNNLKDIEVKIPLGEMTVVCGPSGSGKSSLAFETLFAEGQRRFIESLSNYARQFLNAAPKPDIEGVANIPPAISIEQKNSVKNSRSTVGTTTEIVDYLRLLFEKLGQPYCPEHQVPTSKESVTQATSKVIEQFGGERGYLLVEIPKKGRPSQGKELHANLLKDGFLRIMVPKEGEIVGEVREISGAAGVKKGLPKEAFYLVIDRLSFSEEDRGRLADSMAQAYEASTRYNSELLAARAIVITTEGRRLQVSEDNCCAVCGYQPPGLSTKLFSFNSPYGACPTCKGFGNILEVDEKKVVPNPKLSISEGALNPFEMPSAAHDKKEMLSFCKKQKINIEKPWSDLPSEHRKMIWDGTRDFMGVKGLFAMLEEMKYKMHVRVFISRFRSPSLCTDCHGSRLRAEVNSIYFRGQSLPQLCSMTVRDLHSFFAQLQLSTDEKLAVEEVLFQLRSRLNFLMRVGVHYLSLNRETRTLSGGEYQRLILAHQLGMALSQALYVLDEPTVGLHPRDNDRLISILKELRDLGNTIVIVEHDHDVIKCSENIIEMGPGSGIYGGEVVFAGSIDNFWKSKNSNTVPYLRHDSTASRKKSTADRATDLATHKYKLTLRGASGHNLKNVDIDIPLHRLVAVTGVSGSGKSTLISKTLYPTLCRALDIDYPVSQPCVGIEGIENIKNVVLLDQSPIGRSLRSNILTYMKTYDIVRNIMAATTEAKQRGLTPGHFSLNVDGGRCPACKGLGFEEIDMIFMDNVTLKCEICDGKRFQEEVLEVRFQDKNILEILNMTIEEGTQFFVNYPNIRKSLSFLKEVGLEYLRLGQAASSFSGGESQRLKIAKELSQVNQSSTLYILDEPTTGLHFREVEMLMTVLHRLIDSGASVIVVEHNLDVISGADYVIDMGPEGGHEGGQVVFTGSPKKLTGQKSSLTGMYLAKHLNN